MTKNEKELFSRIFVGLLGGIVISYLITIGISLAIGDGSYYSCVPSLIERFGNEVTAIIIDCFKCRSWSRICRSICYLGNR